MTNVKTYEFYMRSPRGEFIDIPEPIHRQLSRIARIVDRLLFVNKIEAGVVGGEIDVDGFQLLIRGGVPSQLMKMNAQFASIAPTFVTTSGQSGTHWFVRYQRATPRLSIIEKLLDDRAIVVSYATDP